MTEDHGPGDHVMVTVDPARNCGSPSLSRRMVPLPAVLGLLLAGELLAVVRDEHDLTEAEARVVEALAEVVRELSSPEADQDRLVTALDSVASWCHQVADGHSMAVDAYAHMPDVQTDQEKWAAAYAEAARLVRGLVPKTPRKGGQ